ncbi:MAG: hypothetical protein JWO92_6 [Chitinophagaceae bacterium]|nr:hypothetical protein [Chitinophagaceae bacterium]
MSRKISKQNGLYTFLHKQGVLESGDEDLIQMTKRRYWLEYKKNWNKEKLKEYKAYTIHYNQKQLDVITKAADKSNIKITNFIKQSSLANRQNFVDPVAVGEIRELLALHFFFLQSLAEEDKLSCEQADQLLSKITNLEKEVLGVFHKKY